MDMFEAEVALDHLSFGGEPDEAARQRVVARYGLSGPASWRTADWQLGDVVARLQRLLPDADCAIAIIDGDLTWVLRDPRTGPVSVTARAHSLCGRVLSLMTCGEFYLTPDASEDALLADSPWVNGQAAAIRGYAAFPLIGAGGYVLGTMCAGFPVPGQPRPAHLAALVKSRDEALAVLESRRRDRAGEPAPAASRAGRHELDTPEDGWNIDAIIDDRAVRTLFQPVVRLDTHAVVGFEALTRGPAGSALEAPAALLKAAAAVGRLGELDWLCRAHALQAAAAANLHPSLSWLINVEPAGLALDCPVHLRKAVDLARTDLRVILEIVERDTGGHVRDLLHAADQARRDSWGVALDDVGAEETSLALLPFLRPDVVKLDMRLIQGRPHAAAAAVTAAVRAYAERTGAVILAEGVETPEHERLARVFGATYAQGRRYGPPAPLPARVPAPRQPIPLRQKLAPLTGETPFDVLSAAIRPDRACRADLDHIPRHLYEQTTLLAEASVTLICLPEYSADEPFDIPDQSALSAANALTVVLGPDVCLRVDSRFQIATVAPGSRMRGEWITIVTTPHHAAAFVARPSGAQGPEGQSAFDYIYTHDRNAVIVAARAFLHQSRTARTAEPLDEPRAISSGIRRLRRGATVSRQPNQPAPSKQRGPDVRA